MNKQSKKVELGVIQHATLENNRAYLLRTEITRSHLNSRICQHCGVKTGKVTPSFYYVLNISLSCNMNIPSFIGNLWWDLLSGNHLKPAFFGLILHKQGKKRVLPIVALHIIITFSLAFFNSPRTCYSATRDHYFLLSATMTKIASFLSKPF